MFAMFQGNLSCIYVGLRVVANRNYLCAMEKNNFPAPSAAGPLLKNLKKKI